uniref:Endoglucanase n=1 Tax=Litchi chinensis TaxID=151069 RepID=A0A4P8NZ02_LITCN|nr:endo-(1,4)-beta-D-glucanase [Litchi chinensis]
MPERTNVWGGSFEISPQEDQNTTEDWDYDGAAYRSRPSEEEVKQSWLLRPEREGQMKKKKKFAYGKMIKHCWVCRFGWFYRPRCCAGGLPLPPPPYSPSGKLPQHNNVSWRSNSCLKDGEKIFINSLVGGGKYDAAGELDHIKDIIKWGTDYMLKTFNSAAQIAGGNPNSKETNPHDLNCWMRSEGITNTDQRQVFVCRTDCPALAGETAAALASSLIVFKDSREYSRKLVHGAKVLFKFATKEQDAKYYGGSDPFSVYYNSTGYWDEFVWAGAWLYCATGNTSYLRLVTDPTVANHSEAFRTDPDRGVLSWNNKHVGTQLLLTRMRMFLGYSYPYEEMLRIFQNQLDDIMCSYLSRFPNFKRTRGGLILLNHGKPRPLQYVVNAVFLTTLYTDYLESIDTHGIHCGPVCRANEDLRRFAKRQMDYILGKNPQRMSYVVGFSDRFPQHVLHREASISRNKKTYSCQAGQKWRDSLKPNPNIIVEAMVGGPDQKDNFRDIRSNYNYTEPTIAGNAGLVPALMALSGKKLQGLTGTPYFMQFLPCIHPNHHLGYLKLF